MIAVSPASHRHVMQIATTTIRTVTWPMKKAPVITMPDGRFEPTPHRREGRATVLTGIGQTPVRRTEGRLVRLVVTSSGDDSWWFQVFARPLLDAVDRTGNPIRKPDLGDMMSMVTTTLEDITFTDPSERDAVLLALMFERHP